MKVCWKKWWILSTATSSKRRRISILLKVLVVVTMFGLYVFFLMQESISVIEKSKQGGVGAASNSHVLAPKFKSGSKPKKDPEDPLHKSKGLKTNSLKTEVSTLNPIYEYSEEINANAERDFQQRRQQLLDGCQKWNLFGKHSPNAWEFFISSGHGLAWCNVFKAASSVWLYYFNVLGGYDLSYLQRTGAPSLELARKRFPRPSPNELSEALQSSVSFLIVREPFERLVSAYRNKLEGFRNKYYKLLGDQIVKKFRTSTPSRKKKAKSKPSNGPTFKEFLQFLVHHHATGGRFDEHWSPIYTFCTPCSINFTIIAKTETFQRDTEYIIRQAGLDFLLEKMPKKKTNLKRISNRSPGDTKKLMEKYFSQVDKPLLKKVLDIYGPDFELFGYDPTKYYDLIAKKKPQQQKPPQQPKVESTTAQGGNGKNNGTS